MIAWAVKKSGFDVYPNTVSMTKSGAIDRFLTNHLDSNRSGDRDLWHRLRDKGRLAVVKVSIEELSPL